MMTISSAQSAGTFAASEFASMYPSACSTIFGVTSGLATVTNNLSLFASVIRLRKSVFDPFSIAPLPCSEESRAPKASPSPILSATTSNVISPAFHEETPLMKTRILGFARSIFRCTIAHPVKTAVSTVASTIHDSAFNPRKLTRAILPSGVSPNETVDKASADSEAK